VNFDVHALLKRHHDWTKKFSSCCWSNCRL